MALQTGRYLGILDLEYGSPSGVTPPPQGSMMSSATFDLPVISETVEGAWADVVMRGDPALEPAYVAATQRLVERGAVAISSYCGAAIRHQAALAAAVNVPVVTSSLLLVPMLLRQLPPRTKLGVITLDTRAFGEDLLRLSDPTERMRIVIGGLEGGKLVENEAMCPPQPTDIADIETEIAACVARLRAANPEIAALLFSCTLFPPATPMIRRTTGLPVYDITTICRMTLQSIA
ncbi:hypothetical protein [Ensifer sp. LCM 4579]|uniref:hypothetical protein n=1 Tax=Ensifer sp. LCM 4579 TaxID=1848292 RepID=UPI0008DABE8D|nr:hypothetical protein [Ensifer sp. LCM 4579]OHV78907.1 hypothetical protein LCM4579_24765 [Ensifer sp. LCM 4579]